MGSDRYNLADLLQQLPKGTEIFVRQGDQCGEAVPVVLDDDGKLTLYLTTFHQQLADREVPGLDKQEWLKPYPKHLREVCPHGRDIMGTCGSCDYPDFISLGNELGDLPPADKRDRRAHILAAVSDLALDLVNHGREADEDLPQGSIEEAIKAGEIEVEEISAAFALALHEALGDDLGL